MVKAINRLTLQAYSMYNNSLPRRAAMTRPTYCHAGQLNNQVQHRGGRLPETNGAKFCQQLLQAWPSPRKHSPDGATKARQHTFNNSFATHLSIPKGRKAELAQFIHLQRTVYRHKCMVTRQLQVKRRRGKVRRRKTDVLPLCYAKSWCLTGKYISDNMTQCSIERNSSRYLIAERDGERMTWSCSVQCEPHSTLVSSLSNCCCRQTWNSVVVPVKRTSIFR